MSLPQITAKTALAIDTALQHQYGVPMGFVLITMTATSVERARLLIAKEPSPDGPPEINIAAVNMPNKVGNATLINAAEALLMIEQQAKTLEDTKGNA